MTSRASTCRYDRIGAPGLWGAEEATAGGWAEPLTSLLRSPEPASRMPTTRETNLRVLIADEDEQALEGLGATLELLGH